MNNLNNFSWNITTSQVIKLEILCSTQLTLLFIAPYTGAVNLWNYAFNICPVKSNTQWSNETLHKKHNHLVNSYVTYDLNKGFWLWRTDTTCKGESKTRQCSRWHEWPQALPMWISLQQKKTECEVLQVEQVLFKMTSICPPSLHRYIHRAAAAALTPVSIFILLHYTRKISSRRKVGAQ